jgi:Holliday junction resolvasome RuvABC ATP-dependent DNA helicase subunit
VQEDGMSAEVLTEMLPVHAPGGRLRRTLLLEEQLDQAQQSHAQVLLTGPGVHDILVTRGGASQPLIAFLHGYCRERGIGYFRYTMAEGIKSYRTLPGDQAASVRNCDPGTHPADAIQQALTDLRARAIPAMLAFDYADGVLDSDHLSLDVSILCEQLQALTADTGWHQAGLRLVLVDRGGGITSRLAGQPGIRTIHVGPPDQTELTIFAGRAVRAASAAPLLLEPSLSEEETGRRARGLLNLHLHEMRLASSPANPVTAERIAAVKAAAIRDTSGGTLELMPARASFAADVAGLPAVRLTLADAQRAGRTTLQILLSGPPGTGKTLAATAIAEALNVPAVRYGEILNEYVGVAERNMARANQILRAMAPLVLFIDEADQVGLGARGATVRSSEVHQHLRAALFEFLGDTGEQNGITVVATTNVPGRLDNAALSRFKVLPVLFASAAELVQIIGIHARRLGITLEGDLTDVLADYTAVGGVLSGRSAVHLLDAAHVQALRAGHDAVTSQHVQAALDGWVGHDWTPAAEYSTLSSLLTARHSDAWPWVAAAQLGETYDIPAYLRPYLTGAGQVDVDQMRGRAAELSHNQIFAGLD